MDQAEEKVTNNEISENDFIQICNNIKEEKETDKVLIDSCDFNPIGDQRSIQGQPELFIVFSSENPVENHPRITREDLRYFDEILVREQLDEIFHRFREQLDEIFHRFREQPHSSSRLLREEEPVVLTLNDIHFIRRNEPVFTSRQL